MQANLFNPYASEFNPFVLEDAKPKAFAFINDPQPLLMNTHHLNPNDIEELWRQERELCESILQKIHGVFRGFQSDLYPIRNKYNEKGDVLGRYKAMVVLGANDYAAENGSIIAAELIAYTHMSGAILPVNTTKAFHYLEIATKSKSPYSVYLYGIYRLKQYPNRKERVHALRCLAFAAKCEVLQAQYELGNYFMDSSSKTRKKGIELLEEISEKGYARAQFKLSELYFYGRYVAMNREKSTNYLMLAGNQGYLQAWNNIGCYYHYGLGLEKNDIRAVSTFRKAAKRGSVSAQRNLAFCYTNGIGYFKNLEKAFKWSERARVGKKDFSGLVLGNSDVEVTLSLLLSDP